MSYDTKELAEQLAAAAARQPVYPEGDFEGRGIVICAGGARMFACAWVCIGMLRRHLGCTLPIEVWHIGPEELGPPMRGLLEEFGAQAVDALQVARRHPVRRLGGWELKPYALLHSCFREVLLLDADNVAIRDPSFLFDRPEFQETGSLFWPDIVRLAPSNRIWEIAGLPPVTTPSFESGQILLDKSRCWRALSLANWMNQRSDAFYDMLHGDKDTFLIAWLLVGQPFHLIRHQVKLLESALCQRDPDGRVLFQHRNQAKWVLNGQNPRTEGFRYEKECLELLSELADRWDGGVFNPPLRSPAARALERRLSSARSFLLVHVSSDKRPVELLPDHRVTGNARSREVYWYVADGADGPELTLTDSNHRGSVLHLGDDGIWRGQALYAPRVPVELIPAEPPPSYPAHAASAEERETMALLLDRALAAYTALPQDADVTRDFAGFIRTLALLEPALEDRLRSDTVRWPDSSEQGRLLRLALEGLASGGASAGGARIERGHSWSTRRYPVGGYNPVD